MKDNLTYTKECDVYPGEYIPMPGIEALLEELKISGKSLSAKPLANMQEHSDFFKLELSLPGVKREDISIHAANGILSIFVLPAFTRRLQIKVPELHEFESDCMERHLLLPEFADVEFISATYNQGVLTLHIPKTPEPVKTSFSQIAVY